MLGIAIALASEVHKNQKDKGGKPYILHPLRILYRLSSYCNDDDTLCCAVMHDIVEDGSITFAQLKEMGFNDEVIKTMKLLTHGPGISYEEYIENMRSNKSALMIKREDLRDNSDITRMKGVTEKDLARLVKYNLAFKRIEGWLNEYRVSEVLRSN